MSLTTHVLLQGEASLPCLDLASVVGRHRQDAVGADERAFRQVDAVAHKHIGRGAVLDAEEFAGIHPVVLPLVAQVVDDVHAPRLRVHVVLAVLVTQVQRHKPGLPIVREENDLVPIRVAAGRQDERRLQRRRGQQRKAEQVVPILAAVVVVVKAAAPPDDGVVDEDEIAALPVAEVFEQVPVLHQLVLAADPHPCLPDVLDAIIVCVLRGDGHGAVAVPRELVGVGGGDEAQAPGLGIRRDLARDDHHRHAQVERLVLSAFALLPRSGLDLRHRHLGERREARDVVERDAPGERGLRHVQDVLVLVVHRSLHDDLRAPGRRAGGRLRRLGLLGLHHRQVQQRL
mmetsp:Transcript_59542/g.172448  ORF Transcript_59542/g.172448 Transcript_59542/m.172448 type:complete len:344 (+) Transcript_59542:882-1913(+)